MLPLVLTALLVSLVVDKHAVAQKPESTAQPTKKPTAEPYIVGLGKSLTLRCGYPQIEHLVNATVAPPKYITYMALRKLRDPGRKPFNRLVTQLYTYEKPAKRKVVSDLTGRQIKVDFIGVTDNPNVTREMGLKENLSIEVKVKEVTCDDIGMYECRVHMPVDPNATVYKFYYKNFYVDTIEHAPIFEVRPPRSPMGMGTSASVTCSMITSMKNVEIDLRVKSPGTKTFINLPADKNYIATGAPGVAYQAWPSVPMKSVDVSFIGHCTELSYYSHNLVLKFVVDSAAMKQYQCYAKEQGMPLWTPDGKPLKAAQEFSSTITLSECASTEDEEKPCGYEATGPKHLGEGSYTDTNGKIKLPPLQGPKDDGVILIVAPIIRDYGTSWILWLFFMLLLICVSVYIVGFYIFRERKKKQNEDNEQENLPPANSNVELDAEKGGSKRVSQAEPDAKIATPDEDKTADEEAKDA